MSRQTKHWLLALVWLSAVFRLPALFANRFHADEALFANWARLIAVWRDPLLQTQSVDKPPLLFYLQALFYPIFGPVEWAARLPNFIAFLLLAPLVGSLAWALYRDERTAVLAATFIVLSPFAIQFSATAFLDPLLVTFLTASLWLATRVSFSGLQAYNLFRIQRAGWSGFCFGLAVATKYQAWLFLPLLVSVGLVRCWKMRQWQQWLAGCLPVLAALGLWEVTRGGRLALWAAQMTSYGGLRLIWSWELGPRLLAWLALGRLLPGSAALSMVLLLSAALLGLSLFRKGTPQMSAFDQLLVFYSMGYFLLHWLLAVPVWDRYLLPILPLAALILGRGMSLLAAIVWSRSAGQAMAVPVLLLLILLGQLPAAVAARDGRLPIGGQPTADQGAAHVAQYLADAPYGTVLYDHWFSWHWRYHFFDKRVYVSWFPHTAALINELSVFGMDGNPHYLALPDSAVARPMLRAIEGVGFQLHPLPDDADVGIRLYRIEPTQ